MSLRKRTLALLLLLALSLCGCAGEKAGDEAAPAAPARAADPEAAPMAESYDAGAVWDRQLLPLPEAGLSFTKAALCGGRLFLSGTDAEGSPVFYWLDPADGSAERVEAPEGLTVEGVSAGGDGSPLILAAGREGEMLALGLRDGQIAQLAALGMPEGFEDSFYTRLSAWAGGCAALTWDGSVLALDTEGKLLKELGRYERLAACFPTEDGLLTARALNAPGTGVPSLTVELWDRELRRTAAYTWDCACDALYPDAVPGCLLLRADDCIFRLRYETGEKTPLIDAQLSGLYGELLPLGDALFFSLERGDPVLWSPASGPAKVLTLASYQTDFTLEALVQRYNESGAACKIQIIDYAQYDQTEGDGKGLDRLRADIIAGFTPDLYDLSRLPARLYAARGLFEDLAPLLPEETAGLSPHVRQALTDGGRLWYLAPFYRALTYCAPESLTGGREDWTAEDFFAAAEGRAPEELFGPAATRDGLLTELLLFDGESYLDRERQSCFFTGSDFGRWLSLAAALPAEGSTETAIDATWVVLGRQSLLAEQLGANPVIALIFAGAYYGGAASFPGFPGSAGGVTLLEPVAFTALSSASRHREEALDFLRYLLSDGVQSDFGYGLPALDAQLDAALERSARRYQELSHEGPYKAYLPYGEGSLEVEGAPYAPAFKERTKEIICRADRLAARDDTLRQLILGECQAYFAGQASLEDTLSRIQSKAQIYLAEQYG